MMECKFTDDEIVKALECCKNLNCFRCPFDGETDCVHKCAEVTLDLINHQKAEIERLNSCVKTEEEVRTIAESVINSQIAFIKSEAIKEFAERLKAKSMLQHGGVTVVHGSVIDNLVKEMTNKLEENNNER